jgi:hypothetical protein
MLILKWGFGTGAVIFWALTPFAIAYGDLNGMIAMTGMAIETSIAAFIFGRVASDHPWPRVLLIALVLGVFVSFGVTWNTFKERREYQARGRGWVIECMNSGSEKACDLSKGVCLMAEDLGYDEVEECNQLNLAWPSD